MSVTLRSTAGASEARTRANHAKFSAVDNRVSMGIARSNSPLVDACGKRAPGLHLKVILNTGALRLNDIREGPPT
ncbi:hypothetical protein [Bradyrhizobium liaoningense]|uniref:hypothetical protein n=1 Tax=Bradyrhizobium liaoningense TaxID=43992 RepID=UPI0012FDDD07|nr:hypothetical protein [Bradyrhizobium liaoningense]